VVAANVLTDALGLVPIGFGLLVTAGTFAAGAALLMRDAVQQAGGRYWVVGAVAVGSVLSYVLADPRIAVASVVAFAASETADSAVFTPLRRRGLPTAVLASSVVAAPLDTVLFLSVAGFPVTPAAVAGQFIVKTAIAGAVAGWIAWRSR
jgi:hypothetical protein